MKILLIGADPNSPTDGVIVSGITYLLNNSFPNCNITYKMLRDTIPQTSEDFHPEETFDIVTVCGTPWLWDSFQNSDKFKNLVRCFESHPEAKKLFMGIGSCLFFKDIKTNLLERIEEVEALRSVYSDATVIVRDSLAKEKLDKAGINCTLLPCPAYFCYGDETPSDEYLKQDNILIFQDPRLSISNTNWQDSKKLDSYFNKMRDFVKEYNPKIFCASNIEVQPALELGFGIPIVLRNVTDTLMVMRTAKNVLSGRVHCAVPALVQGANTELMPLDTRSYVVTDFIDIKDFKPYLKQYQEILTNILPKQVGTESRRTHEEKHKSGFYQKYMSGETGLDVGYAGYTSGIKPILDTAIGIDTDYPGYDGKILPFHDNSQDYVYNSHCLEHINDYKTAIQEWYRVLKPNGHIVIVVPHQYLYEKKATLPSKWNEDHKRFYTPASLLKEVEESLKPNTYRVRLLEDGDKDFDYSILPNKHSNGQYEITLVLQKINPPAWELE